MKTATLHASPIRLAEISVCNWGSFHGLHTAPIDPQGTLITGDNGAGKTTFIDGLMMLLQPMRGAAFNVAAAQGDKSDRSVISYMRGSFGADHEGSNTRIKHKREGAVLTGLRALYRSDEGKEITLLVILLVNAGASSLSEIKRIYLVATENVRLADVLREISDGNIRHFNQWVKSKKNIVSFDERFKDYQAYYRQCLYMDNENAPALLSRALGLKKIDDLTKLIRELVLEPNTIRDEARKIVAEFDDLAQIHARMLDARAQVAHLQDLPDLQNQWHKNQLDKQKLAAEIQALPIYYAQYRAARLREQLVELSGSLQRAKQTIDEQRQRLQAAEDTQEACYADYLNAGGQRIESLRFKEKSLQKQYIHVFQAAQDYQELCRQLNLSDVLQRSIFTQHQTQAQAQFHQLAQQYENAETQFRIQAANHQILSIKLNELKAEMAEIAQRPNSNLPTKQQQWRDEVQAAFQIAPEQLMFIGEMLDVAEMHRDWQGAIERALGGLRTTLLVPKNQFAPINQWLNARHMNAHIRLQAVDLTNVPAVEFQKKGYLSKLMWREHAYQDWLRHFLQSKDLICVENMDEFERTPFSMTREGLQHWQQGRSEKKDNQRINDKSHWHLGFSNQMRLSSLQAEFADVQQQHIEQQATESAAHKQMKTIETQQSALAKLQRIQWTDIDVPQIENQLAQTRDAIEQLLNNQGDMQKAQQRWQAAKQAKYAEQEVLDQANRHEQSLQEQAARTEQELAQYVQAAQQSISENVRQLLAKRFEKQSLDDANYRKMQQQLDQLAHRVQTRSHEIERKADRIMLGFRSKDEWQHYAVEWATDFQAALPDYIAHLTALQNEGLPELVEQQAERLNKHSTQSLMNFEEILIKIHQDIQIRLQKINDVLARTEFMQAHHYLRLGSRPEHYPHVKEFKKKITAARQKYISDDQDLRFQLLQEVIEILKKHIDSSTLESQRLLDPRYQLEFYADVLDKHSDNRIVETLSSSSGKSGGEKEAFAGMIVAASLAYVLTPEGYDRPIYSTVFLDEAFSNTAESVSRRVLNVFKELNLHVNLITPYKNLNLARESARSLIIANRHSEKHESYLSEMTWEEVDKQQLESLKTV